MMRRLGALGVARVGAFFLALHLGAVAQTPPPATTPLPAFAELEAAGATIGEITVRAEDIFDLQDPKEDRWLFRLANKLHMQTRKEVIARALLFKRGDPVSVRVIEETERVLRGNRYLYDVYLHPLAVQDGVVDVEVVTRDTWSLDAGARASRAGGANAGGIHVNEYNLLGSGISLGLGRSRNVDRSSNSVQLSHNRAFGTWTSISASHATNSDGRRDAVSVVRPFYALDARWAAGASASRDERIESVYVAGQVASQYRHRERQGEVFGGWSEGLVNGWTRRYSLGLSLQDDTYAPEPGMTAPAPLPPDQRLLTPFVRLELVEDRFERELNRNLIGRPEFFALGLASTVQLGWAAHGRGSSLNALVYSAAVSRGFEPWEGHTLIASAKVAGQFFEDQLHRKRVGVSAQYYLPQGPRWLFYAGASADMLTRPDPAEQLLLGGEEGLRGYPLRYQSGTRRVLFTAEERFYTDLYVWRLFRIGGAAFFDIGRAWAGEYANAVNPGWLSNAGAGLRIVNARSAFSNVLHIDIAVPLNTTPDMKRLQFLVKTKTSF